MSKKFYSHYLVLFTMLLPIPFPLFGVLIALLWALFKKQVSPWRLLKSQPLVHAFLFLSLLASLLAQNGVGLAVTLSIYLFFLYFESLRQDLTMDFFQSSLSVLSIGSWFQAFYAFLQSRKILFGPDYHAFHPAMVSWRDGRADSVFLNPNYYSMMAAFFILIAAYQLTKGKHKVFYALTIPVNLIGLLLTQSRTALPAVVISLFAFAFMVSSKRYKKGLGFLAGLALLLSPLLQFLPRFNLPTILAHLIDIRFQIWEVSLAHFAKTWPIGSGPMTYMSIYSQYGSYATQHAHNLYIDSLLNYGLIGCILLLLFAITLIKRVHHVKKTDHNLYALAVSFLLMVGLFGLLDVTILWVHSLYLFLLVMTAVYAVGETAPHFKS